MQEEQEEQEQLTTGMVILDHPELFGTPPFDPMETLIGFGFESSKYWLPVLKKGFDDISEIVREQDLTDFRIVQVKEKFGGLRVYTNMQIPEISKIIERMESEVSTICDRCGSTEGTKLRTGGWWQVLCDECANADKE